MTEISSKSHSFGSITEAPVSDCILQTRADSFPEEICQMRCNETNRKVIELSVKKIIPFSELIEACCVSISFE